MANNKFLDLTGLQTYDEKIKTHVDTKDAATLQSAKNFATSLGSNYDPAGTAVTKMQELANGQVKTNTDAITKLNGNDTTEGSVAKAVKDAKDAVEAEIGTLGDLDTTAKTDLVSAINEVRSAVDAGGTEAQITIDTSTTTSGMAKSYTIKQGSSTVGTIDIPKDMVVSSGVVETDPDDQDPGTYLVLTLANATNDKVYINVGNLVDIYTAQASAPKVQLSISDRTISATIVAGAVTATELANNAVVTAKIADGNVTKAKLETAVQTSLGKADTALQAADIVSGTGNGTISVKGSDVAVKGLGSAAYTNSSAYDAAGAATTAETNAKEYADSLAGNYATAAQGAKADSAVQKAQITTGTENGTIAVQGTSVAVKGLGSAAYVATSAFDAAGTAQGLVSTLQNGAVANNTSAISGLDGRVEALEANTYVAITEDEITGLFS